MLKITVKEKPTFKKKRDNYVRRLKTKKLINYLQSELRTSTTHGLPYIVNTEIHWFERVFWAANFGIACAIIFVLLSAQYTRLVEAPIVNSVEKDYLNWNVSYPTIVLCPIQKIDNEILTSCVNGTLNKTGYNLEAYYSSIMSVSLETLNVLDLPSPEILKLIQPEEYSTIAANLFKRFNSQTLMTSINWPITIDATMTEMGMCHMINSNTAVLDDPTQCTYICMTKHQTYCVPLGNVLVLHCSQWSDSSVAYTKNNIEISVHDIDFFVQILNYAKAYKVYTLSPDEVILSGAPSLTFDSEGFLSFGVQITSTRASEDLKYIPLHRRKCRQGRFNCITNLEARLD